MPSDDNRKESAALTLTPGSHPGQIELVLTMVNERLIIALDPFTAEQLARELQDMASQVRRTSSSETSFAEAEGGRLQ